MSSTYEGIIASNGITMGNVYLFKKNEITVDSELISAENVEFEQQKLKKAMSDYKKELENRTFSTKEEEEITNAHKELISDPYLYDTITTKIVTELNNAQMALKSTIDEMVSTIELLDDEYLKERATDYKDIGEQILYKLKGIKPASLSNLPEDVIIVSKELTPSDTSTMDKTKVLGFATDLGAKTSHTSIIAQTMGIPAIVGMSNISEKVNDGDFVIIDANVGNVIVSPTEEEKEEYRSLIKEQKEEKDRLEKIKNKVAKTIDGCEKEVSANIGNLEDLDIAINSGCDGVGLFRTEFLYMENSHFPTEEEQFEVYKQAALKLDGKPLIIRTLDIGGDKNLKYFDFPKEDNPFLGFRAIRFCLKKPGIFRTQLKAILRASAFGKVRIMFPMVINVSEIIESKKIIEDIKKELDDANISYDKNIEVGIMVETPSSVVMADQFIKYVDFFSIGTNDLTQYLLAVDRGNENISYLYSNYNPAVLRAIKHIIKVSHDAGKWTGMCGSFASDTKATKLLLGLGLDEFSGAAGKISKVKDTILNSNYEEEKEFSDSLLNIEDVEEIEKIVFKHNK
ncbi:MAG: phosphoenolpyruvate--protein phosphotransferase [Peptoniphilaceae bacterium]|nr:phosphoenolpyruvate--protein phosphotransferase [Peptoniphilaceae bacterium]MDD7383550.1 phosphoenolpyruvate--protein phosphotransferase [Peptoniphilaceae bacterium]MDY3738723.1 phosphoenolpyruvate--protein phosphotransferase [Peptoniphilaceae bacterium]